MKQDGREVDHGSYHHTKGVGVITTKEVHNILLQWKPISERYNSGLQSLVSLSAMHHLRTQKHHAVDETPSVDVLLIMGGLKAQVGVDHGKWIMAATIWTPHTLLGKSRSPS